MRVRLLGEDLVAFRDTDGESASSRSTARTGARSLFYGRNEECGLRCVYHGWKFDVTGQCVDHAAASGTAFAPADQDVTSYPTHESGGIVWTYMGPAEP